MAERTASRYQRGLSYEPGLAQSRYRPERSGGTVNDTPTGVGGGVTPIPGVVDDGGVVAPSAVSGGSGLGGGALGLGALSLLANPNILRQVSNLLGGSGAGAVSGVTQGSTSGLPAVAPGAPVEGVAALSPESATQGASNFGAGAAGGALGGGLATYPEFGAAFTPVPGTPLSGFSTGGGLSAIPDGSGAVADGGGAILDGMGGIDGLGSAADVAGNGMGGAFGYGGLSLVPQDYGLGTLDMLGTLPGGIDVLGGLGTLGAGYLGTQWANQAPYEGSRDPLGSEIGSGLGSAVGGLFLGPIGAFLGAQFGGMLGGQFGPQATVGPNWTGGYTWSPQTQDLLFNSFNANDQTAPTSLPSLGWQYGSGADNGGQVNDQFANAFQQALLGLAQQRGYSLNPQAVGAGYGVGQFLDGQSMTAPGFGYFYRGNNDAADSQGMFFGNDLTAAWAPDASGKGFANYMGPISGLGANATAGDAMLQYAWNNLLGQGLFVPQGQAVTNDAAMGNLLQQAQQNWLGSQQAAQQQTYTAAGGGN